MTCKNWDKMERFNYRKIDYERKGTSYSCLLNLQVR